jgi:hypothetical protein
MKPLLCCPSPSTVRPRFAPAPTTREDRPVHPVADVDPPLHASGPVRSPAPAPAIHGAGRRYATGLLCTAMLACTPPAWTGPGFEPDPFADAGFEELHADVASWAPDAWGPDGCAAAVMLTEIHYDPPGPDGDGEAEFIELSAPPGTSLDGWRLQAINGANAETYRDIALRGRVGSDGLWVVGGGQVASAHQVLPGSLQQGPDAVALFDCEGREVQRVLYGAAGTELGEGQAWCACATADLWSACLVSPGLPNPACATPCPDSACTGADVGSLGDSGSPDAGFDATDSDAGIDARDEDTGAVQADATISVDAPGPREGCEARLQQGVRIAEVLYDPPGADSASAEFIELSYPDGARTGGMRLEHLDGANGEVVWQLELPHYDDQARTTLGLDGAASAGEPLPGALQNGPDLLVLSDCAGVVVDVAVWGGTPPEPPTWLQGALVGESTAAGQSLSRCESAPGESWVYRAASAPPTPDAPNGGWRDPWFCPPACTPAATAGVRIAEVMYDPTGADAGSEYLVLSGTPGTVLEGLVLEWMDGGRHEVLGATAVAGRIASDGHWVLGGADVPETDAALTGSIQNGPDGVVLRNCEGAAVDAVAWGRFESAPAWGEGAAVPAGREGCAMVRDGADSGDNARDFVRRCTGTAAGR